MRRTEVQSLEARRHASDQKRNALLDTLSALTPDQLTAKPAPEAWSLLQVAQPLMLAERAVLQHLPEPSRLEERKRSPRNRLLYRIVLGILFFGVRVKVPSLAMEPDGETTLEDVRRRWDESQSWLQRVLATLSAEHVDRAVFNHPVSGPLTPSQTLTLADVHFDAHVRRICDRIETMRHA